MKKFLHYLRNGILLFLLPFFIYLLLAIIGSTIPVNKNETNKEKKIPVFLITNGAHTDLAVPIQSSVIDWNKIIEKEHFNTSPRDYQYIGFGWGDLEFYRTTPQWEDLTLKTAFNSLFLETPAALHLELHEVILEDENTIALSISKEQYAVLVEYFLHSFQVDKDGSVQPVPGLHYNSRDAFYHAKGSLNTFKTCNTWINNGLKKAGMKACLWTPFTQGIFYQYP
ncbi:TIGR02117 family protein [Autumnicola edwardsiae]|uniref:TIGR02117 family protein n=1 Tax=Autumnicola edwardsiae TaxID=3075594 RepID=A0ABU3CWL5_9FLAO|nr:TIGR02117 family protein [Zunongwangia sp. F297]MDT0650305.1 TIGR02117 family protein [Zunongwangia sp. F297]